MEKLLKKLRHLLSKKENKDKTKRNKYIFKQIALLEKLEKESDFDKKYTHSIIEQIKKIELTQEYNISKKEMLKLMKEKEVESHFINLFEEEYAELHRLFINLKKLFQEQLSSTQFNPDYSNESVIYNQVDDLLSQFHMSEEKIIEYFNDVKKLTYKKKYIKSGQIISKIIKGALIKIEINGIEHIPRKGACIIAPYHYHAAFDPLILMAVIDRSLFFATSVETFVSIPLYDRLLYNLGCLPIKRDDALFQDRLKNAIPQEKIENYKSSNLGSIKKMLTHLKYGDAIVIFPEGEAKMIPTYVRSNNEDFLDPQTGFVSFAFLAERRFGKRVPIIPIGLSYGGRIFKKIVINIGEPVYLNSSLQKMKKSELKKSISQIANEIFSNIRDLS